MVRLGANRYGKAEVRVVHVGQMLRRNFEFALNFF